MSRFQHFVSRFLASSQFQKQVAIDVGSFRTRVVVDGRIIWNQPSVAVIHQGSLEAVAIGNRGQEMRGKLPLGLVYWQPTQRGQLRLGVETQVYLQAVLSQVLDQRQRVWFVPLHWVVPVQMTPSYQRGLEKLVSAAKGQLATTLTQPTAVWQWLRHQRMVESQGCVLVIGHGITEIGYFQRDLTVSEAKIPVAGQDFGDSVRESVRSELQLEVSAQVVEELKRQVARLQPAEESAQEHRHVVKGKHILSQIPGSAVVTDTILQSGLKATAERLANEVRLFLQSLPSDSVGSLLDQGIILTGGGSQLPGLATFLEQQLNLRVTASETPEIDVIQGVAKYGQNRHQ